MGKSTHTYVDDLAGEGTRIFRPDGDPIVTREDSGDYVVEYERTLALVVSEAGFRQLIKTLTAGQAEKAPAA